MRSFKLYKYIFTVPFSTWFEKDKTYFISEFVIIDAFYITMFEMNFMFISDILKEFISDILKEKKDMHKEIITYWEKWKKWKESPNSKNA